MTRSPKKSPSSTVDGNLPEEKYVQIDPPPAPVRVLVVESSEVLRLGFCRFVESREGLALAGETATRLELIALSTALEPDVLLLDVHLADSDAFQTTREIKAMSPNTQILISGESEKIDDVRAVLDHSVRGYLLKHASFDEIEAAILRVHAGRDYISEDLAKRLLANMTAADAGGVES